MTARRERWIVVVALVAGIVGGAAAQWLLAVTPVFADKTSPHAKVVRAETFELVDADAHVHAELQIGVDGNPALIFYDVDHQVRAVFDLTGGGNARLFLSDDQGKTRATFGLGKDGAPFLHFIDEDRALIWSAP